MAKVLANRLGISLMDIISPEQTAFLHNRSIGDSIMLLQTLPKLLKKANMPALAVFCDFEKAYDTIDRNFLFAVLEALGLGQDFISLVEILLPTTTYSRAITNNFISEPQPFYAGVRQGCPLAPLLYLCIAEALLRLLKHQEIGITVRGRRFTASQFADDAEVFLPDQSAVPKFLETMRTFEKASGQKLNVEKTKILKIGAHPTFTAATELHGIPVAPTAKALGIIFSQFTGDPIKNFEPLIAKLDRSYSSISNWRFTIFGRAHATGCYGVTRLLHHAEYSGLLTIAQQQHLTKITAKLVDRGQAPSDPEHVFAGLHQEILFGRREEGGFGAFPWKQHIQARHAVLGLKIITGDPTIPWISAARDLLQDAGLDIWTIVWDRTSIVNLEIGGHLGCCLAALRELPAPEMLEALPAPGPWCFDAPLWGYLPHYKTIENNTYCLEEQMARVLSNIAHSSIRTLGQLALASYLSLSYELQPSLYGTGVAHD